MKFYQSLEKSLKSIKRKFLALALATSMAGCQWNLPLPPIIDPNAEEEVTTTTTTTSTTTTTTIPETTTTTTIYTPPTTTTTTTTTIPTPIEEKYLVSRFDFGTYSIGSSFDRTWTIQNISDKNVTFNNTLEHISLSYKILRKREDLPEEDLFGFDLKEPLNVQFWPLGYIQIQTNAHDTKFTITNCSVFYDGKSYEIPYPMKFSRTENLENLVINNSGDYWIKANLLYKVEGETQEYESHIISPVVNVP